MRAIDETGNRYGEWRVLRPGKNKGEKRRWWVRCSCGNDRLVLVDSLRSGRSRSCGCWRRSSDRRGVAAFDALFRSYRRAAAKRGIDWRVSEELFRRVTSGPCFYCGREPFHEYYGNKTDMNGGCVKNGIDRLDSFGVYEEKNIVPCCKECNMAKGKRFVDDFTTLCSRVYEHQTRWIADPAFLRGSRSAGPGLPPGPVQ